MDGLAILAAVFVVYALVASKLDRWSITAPMVFTATGFLLGPSALNLLPLRIGDEVALTVVELTLALLLFADASTVRLREVEGDTRLPGRLLFIGFPLTIALGTIVAGWMVPEAGWASAAVVATILAPTDAALGLPVFTNTAVPVRIRRALNVESGLNDGLATPFLTLFLALLASEEGVKGYGSWLLKATEQIGLAVVAAIVVGVVGGRLLTAAHRRGWTSHVSEQLAILALALLAYGGALAIDGNGFVSAFVAGILFGRITRGRMHRPVEFTETLALFSSFVVWTLFGALLVGPVLSRRIAFTPIAYAALSLTVIRMVPVAVSWAGLGLRSRTIAFAGWFGTRGLASVVFTILTIQTLHVAGIATDTIVEMATWTILLSVFLHGLTAAPLSRWYGRWVGDQPSPLPELADAPEPRLRRRSLGHHPGR